MDALWMRLVAFSNRTIMVLAVVAALIYYFMFFNDGSSLQKRIDETNTTIGEEESKATLSEAALREVEQVRAAVGTLVEQFKSVSAQIPTEVAMSDVIRAVDMVSKSASVSIRSKEPQATKRVDILEEIPLRIQMEGTYGEITTFLLYISSQERIMKVRNFKISTPTANIFSGRQERNTGRLNFEGEIVSYRYVEETPDTQEGGSN